MERYFLISYTGVVGFHSLHHGCLYIVGPKFPSRSEIITGAKGLSPQTENIVITSIYEFKSKADYETFIAA